MLRMAFGRVLLGSSAFSILVIGLGIASVGQSPGAALARIQANSNQTAAGKLENGVLTLHLELRQGDWYPEAETGPSMKVYAFAEEGGPLQVPGPLIRVPEGVAIHLTVRNLLPVKAVLHGLHPHPGDEKAVDELAPNETREWRFPAGAPGTYEYYASAGSDLTRSDHGRPFGEDSQLAGAFIVDPRGGAPADRVFVITLWRSGTDFGNTPRPSDCRYQWQILAVHRTPYLRRGRASALAVDQCQRHAASHAHAWILLPRRQCGRWRDRSCISFRKTADG